MIMHIVYNIFLLIFICEYKGYKIYITTASKVYIDV